MKRKKIKAFNKETIQLRRKVDKEAKSLHKDIDDKAFFEREKIDEIAWKRYYSKYKDSKDFDPDAWDFDYADEKLAKLYEEVSQEHEKINKTTSQAHKEVESYLLSKYGQQTIDNAREYNTKSYKRTTVALTAGMMTIPISLLAGTAYLASKH